MPCRSIAPNFLPKTPRALEGHGVMLPAPHCVLSGYHGMCINGESRSPLA
jgi:hypothetical protein